MSGYCTFLLAINYSVEIRLSFRERSGTFLKNISTRTQVKRSIKRSTSYVAYRESAFESLDSCRFSNTAQTAAESQILDYRAVGFCLPGVWLVGRINLHLAPPPAKRPSELYLGVLLSADAGLSS